MSEALELLKALRDMDPELVVETVATRINVSEAAEVGIKEIERLTQQRDEAESAVSRYENTINERDRELARLRAEVGKLQLAVEFSEGQRLLLRAEVERLTIAHDHQRDMAALMLREAERTGHENEKLRKHLATLEA